MTRYNQIDDIEYLQFCLFTLNQIDTRFGEVEIKDRSYTPPCQDEITTYMYLDSSTDHMESSHLTEWKLF